MTNRESEQEQLALLEATISAYYDNLTEAEIEEDRAWGEFAGSHLASDDL